jgi:hypothetical protein
MTDDIKDRALALVRRYGVAHDTESWGNEVRALAREAEAAEKKWRIMVTHSWMNKTYTRVDAEELMKDVRADYPGSHVEIVPADSPLVPPRFPCLCLVEEGDVVGVCALHERWRIHSLLAKEAESARADVAKAVALLRGMIANGKPLRDLRDNILRALGEEP